MKLTKEINSLLIIFLIIMTNQIAQSKTKIKIACVGNSVTYGFKLKNRKRDSYPAQLQKMLGKEYLVGNFGHSGATVLREGHKPYWAKSQFKEATDFDANIVIIHLGLNDVGLNNWPQHGDDFVKDYSDLIKHFRDQPSNPEVKICRLSPIFSGHHWFEEGLREYYKEAQRKIDKIAQINKVEIIDLHKAFYRFPELFPDQLHPKAAGARKIAEYTYSAITGDFGGLKVSRLYSENMVIQQNEPIIFSGKADKKQQVEVLFANSKKSVVSGSDGNWSVTFPPMQSAKNLSLKIRSQEITINIGKVHIGEVWVASGQSNMYFKMKELMSADSMVTKNQSNDIFFLNMQPQAFPNKKEFTRDELLKCNANDYFKIEEWSVADSNNIEKFSAIAYSFAYNLQRKLNVPIGIISNSVGGSTIQSWIGRRTMELQHITVDLLNDSHKNPHENPWVESRKALNFKNSRSINARHPFEPTFLFDSGVYPLKDYNIRGVLWYQGESNAEREELYELLFQSLVYDWRQLWKKPNLPFHYVQLSSLKRKNWAEFRDCQRRLLRIPNTGMAVSHDNGDETDVHPKNKWPIGERLSRWALSDIYGHKIVKSGPLFDYANIVGDKIEINFNYVADGLITANGESLKGFEIANKTGNFIKAYAKIKKGKVLVSSDKISKPRYVRYGWKPYTDANLSNTEKLPASTFTNYKGLMEL